MTERWIKVAATAELPPGSMKRVDIEQYRYLIVNVDGKIYAVDDTCSHEEVSLYLGCIENHNIKCSLHGSRFCLKTGRPLEEPADEPIGTYPVKINDNQILIQPKF
ncbi:MAG: non-heme iron oxygenase ferredoxin subunit [Candidatus Thiodiazotropha weberae]|nr:non-heme iron oxygenase ferredoxin subunit [Candidatus Thiodiazotropha lotti]MCG7988694.1 non-heme iron oxygenase ferredoxin subunit [Candidatus Thiodiazotropha lotti]MCG8012823.1 non-heme iron oxygenase ferredoxin subunit [Candidatus Thiodiazotropha lotti]MCG8019704.1 non-heme iron oxygenase ferredoxin subunit [Candidatus Thiodiazotropha lotti]MCW4206866.1 non-heme iron oxygenase ferredoxin subunit [Candidatus Thiodiazotropha lotti]